MSTHNPYDDSHAYSRIKLQYRSGHGSDTEKDRELPLRLLIMGNFKGHREDTPLAERKAIPITPKHFATAMYEANISTRVTDTNGDPCDLHFGCLQDFHPDNIVQQHPQLRLYQYIRELFSELKSPYIPRKRRADIKQEIADAILQLAQTYKPYQPKKT